VYFEFNNLKIMTKSKYNKINYIFHGLICMLKTDGILNHISTNI